MAAARLKREVVSVRASYMLMALEAGGEEGSQGCCCWSVEKLPPLLPLLCEVEVEAGVGEVEVEEEEELLRCEGEGV
jgi:hypothetical protein